MSTTVTYKGQTLATVSNQTKTLLTEGKYLEDDLTLTDVSGGGAVLTTKNISANGTYNASSDSADGYSQVTVAVPASAVDTGTKNITANGNGQDVIGYAAVNVNVPNSYSAGDEGKVVSNGALVAQTSDTVTANDTYDTTLINSLTVNVSGGGGGMSIDDFLGRTAPSGEVSAPTATKMYGHTFYENQEITSFSAPNITRIGAYDFERCNSLRAVNMPELVYASDIIIADASITYNSTCHAFRRCDYLETINLPKLQQPGGYMFYQCGYDAPTGYNYKTIIVLPSVLYAGHSMFRQGRFKAVDFGSDCVKLWNDAFYAATIDVVILRSSTLVAAANRDAIRNIKTLYVPQSLISDYATASNWSIDAASRTVNAIEGSQYENYYADGTPISS